MSELSTTVHDMERNLTYFKWSQVFGSFALFIPIFTLYLDFKGLTFTQFLSIQAIVPATRALFQLKFGYLGDIWKRRTFAILAAFLFASSYVVLYFVQGFWLAIPLFMWGISFGCSGLAFSPLLYETLLSLGREKEHTKVAANVSSFVYFGIAISAFSSGFLFWLSPHLPLYLQVIALSFYCYMVLKLKEPVKHKQICEKTKGLFYTLKTTVWPHKDLIWIAIASAVLLAAFYKANWVIQPSLKSIDVPVMYFGIASTFIGIFQWLGSNFVHKMAHRFTDKYFLTVAFVLSFVSYSLAASIGGFIVPFILLFNALSFGMVSIVVNTMVHERIGSHERSRVMSIFSIIASFFYGIIITVFSLLMETWGISAALACTAILILTVAIISMYFIENKPKKPS